MALHSEGHCSGQCSLTKTTTTLIRQVGVDLLWSQCLLQCWVRAISNACLLYHGMSPGGGVSWMSPCYSVQMHLRLDVTFRVKEEPQAALLRVFSQVLEGLLLVGSSYSHFSLGGKRLIYQQNHSILFLLVRFMTLQPASLHSTNVIGVVPPLPLEGSFDFPPHVEHVLGAAGPHHCMSRRRVVLNCPQWNSWHVTCVAPTFSELNVMIRWCWTSAHVLSSPPSSTTANLLRS